MSDDAAVHGTGSRLPLVVGDTTELPTDSDVGRGGSIWRLEPADRDLDANVIALPPGDAIDSHAGPNLGVLIHVLAGSGTLTTEASEIPLTVGALVWLPPTSQRRFVAGDAGLTYFSVHQRKPRLNISA